MIAPDLDVLFCGINPGLYTAAVGHHFGRPGNRFWPVLHRAGFTPRLFAPSEQRDLLALGYGITNIVARATTAADELTRDELVDGARVLTRKVMRFRPRYLAIVGIGAYRTSAREARVAGRDDRRDEDLGAAESERTQCKLSPVGARGVVRGIAASGGKEIVMASIALWALVIALGLQTGAGIYETRVIVPLWADVPQRFFAQPLRPDSGKRLWIILSPILSIISIINLIYAFGAMEPKRTWWIAASAISVAVMIMTFAYFVPALLAIARASEGDDVIAKAKTWVALNYVRAIAVITAWLLALKAFSYVGQA